MRTSQQTSVCILASIGLIQYTSCDTHLFAGIPASTRGHALLRFELHNPHYNTPVCQNAASVKLSCPPPPHPPLLRSRWLIPSFISMWSGACPCQVYCACACREHAAANCSVMLMWLQGPRHSPWRCAACASGVLPCPAAAAAAGGVFRGHVPAQRGLKLPGSSTGRWGGCSRCSLHVCM